jgi:hypothetical protein
MTITAPSSRALTADHRTSMALEAEVVTPPGGIARGGSHDSGQGQLIG